MHELSVVKALIDAVVQHAAVYQREQFSGDETVTDVNRNEFDNNVAVSGKSNINKVKVITVEVGELTCIEPQRLVLCFDLVKSACGMKDCLLEICQKQTEVRCRQCQAVYHPTSINQPCHCGSRQQAIVSGAQLHLTAIEFI